LTFGPEQAPLKDWSWDYMKSVIAYNYHYTLEYIEQLSQHDVNALLGTISAMNKAQSRKSKKK